MEGAGASFGTADDGLRRGGAVEREEVVALDSCAVLRVTNTATRLFKRKIRENIYVPRVKPFNANAIVNVHFIDF